MSTDVKILNKLLENETQEHIKKIVYHDQGGFIIKMQGYFIIYKLANIIYHINSPKDKTT